MVSTNVAVGLSVPRPKVVQARAKATRLKLLRQAEIAFASKGLNGASLTADILDPAEVSVGSFYHQFENKREVMLELLAWRLEQRQMKVSRALVVSQRTWASMLLAMSLAFLDDIDQHPNIWVVQFRELQSPDPIVREAIIGNMSPWEDAAAELLKRFSGAPEDRCRTVARTTMLCLNNVLRDYSAATLEHRESFRDRVLAPAVELCVGGAERMLGATL